jgi:A/G-specific adenine glycosylase
MQEHGGRFPQTSEALARLPGIGRSTAAAIAAFCFGERVAILDGNVKRVLARWLAYGADLAEARHERALWEQATALLPDTGIETYTQALMDLGATLCTARVPRCEACPVRADCRARAAGDPARYPVKSRQLRRGAREHVWLWLAQGGRIWLVPRPARGIWAGLWSLPEFDSAAAFGAASAGWPGEPEPLPSFVHTLTHLDWTLHPVRWTLPARLAAARLETIVAPWPGGRWYTRDAALSLGLPAPLRRLIEAG